ncbi:GTPase-activating protein isoform X2 [Anthonomus grandis grandis]|uniref:GTPase-activating protein isoform X2 n=1 Tax=Anthonomus grandis grandis TaxID=2921223 RepID=UPI002165672A|nr:GTPase-activating protein isoform X2 [Anthonomus grandis grandis]
MADDYFKVRLVERLKIKIGEAKNLPCRSHSSATQRDVYCTLSLDQEEIFRTSTVYQTLSPFFGEEFQFDVPRNFRYISLYIFDRDKQNNKQDKVLGKVAIRREHLASYNNRDHWFPIKAVDADSEVQGKANIAIKFEPVINQGNKYCCDVITRKLLVQVVECLDLTLKNGTCDPYALISVTYTNGKRHSKKTKVRKKTTRPQFEEVFSFNCFDDSDHEVEICELLVSIWHDTPGINDDVFLGEVRVQLRGFQQQNAAHPNAWYFLQPRSGRNRPFLTHSTPPGTRLSSDNTLGSLRLQVQYTEDRVFPAGVYENLKTLLLSSLNVQPITNSSIFILGEIINKIEIAPALVRILLHAEKVVPVIRALADVEIANVTDATTIFRGNTLVSKMMDEAMRLIGLQYLHKTLRPTLELIISEKKPCEIDPTRVKDPNTIQVNQANLKFYIQKIFEDITQSAVHCPSLMCQIFYHLKECAMTYFQNNSEVRYSVISGFIFLRFFAPAILGPRLFDLTTQAIDYQTNRTLTLISKTIQSLGNLVSCRSTQQVMKEEYMEFLYKAFCTDAHKTAMRKFLEIISASTSSPPIIENDKPVTLKEGLMIKRAQGRKRFGRKNFKQRYFKLTTQNLSYSKSRGKEALCVIPLNNILAVERLAETSFKMKNMFQIVQPERALYVQAANCVEEKEWVDLLTKICQTNANRLQKYHPSAFINGEWMCCKSPNELAPGCSEVSQVDSNNYHMTLDSERDLQRVHSLVIAHVLHLERFIQMLDDRNPEIRDVMKQLLEVSFAIEDRHQSYRRTLNRNTKYGSLAAPIGDDNYLLASRMNLDPNVLLRHRGPE